MSLISRAACGAVVIAVTLSACVAPPPQPRETSSGHLSEKPTVVPAEIPEPVAQAPFVPPPKPEPPVETYTVVVNEVPVKELLFALSRDAKINVDVHPNISGNVTLNAVDQTLSQILDRISRQIDVRHELRNGTIVVMPDTPFLRSYKIDYVNVTRESAGTIGASTLIAAGGEGGGGANTSQSTISNTINNRFWETLQSNVEAIVRQDSGAVSDGDDKGVTLNREGGLILVRATARQHQMVSDYLDKVMASITRQVLIEATIVEVQLSDRYQAGIDWTALARSAFGLDLVFGADVGQAFEAGASGGVTGLIFDYADKPDASSELDVTINLLNEFGDAQVLSSPKVMTLNNQPAVLKVVDNEVYFEIEIDTTQSETQTLTTVESNARTVSVGLVLTVTPQISESEAVTLNVRPTITRVREFVDDPSVPIALANAQAAALLAGLTPVDVDVANKVPVVQVRETETVMRIGTGQLAVLGGLMQDQRIVDDESVPGFSEVPGVGELFKFRDRQQVKTELVIFLRPTVIRSPDIGRDFSSFQRYLPKNIQDNEALPSLVNPFSQN
jgi:general secretion pathway protein D